MDTNLIRIYKDEEKMMGASFWNSEIENLSDADLFYTFGCLIRYQKELSDYMYKRLNDYSNRYLKPVEKQYDAEQINTNFKILLDKYNKLEKQIKTSEQDND